MSANGLYNGALDGLHQGLYDGTINGASNGTDDSNLALLPPSFDDDARTFITNHQINTGQIMGVVQQRAINNRYLRYKGILPNPNGSNLWALFNAQSVKPRIWIHCPINDNSANALAYQMEFITKTPLGTFNNFSASDFTVRGVIGGITQFFNTGISPNSYPLNAIGSYAYARTLLTTTGALFGSSEVAAVNGYFLILRTTAGSEIGYRVNDNNNNNTTQVIANLRGLLGMERTTSALKRFIRNGVIGFTSTESSTARNVNNIYFHGRNEAGTMVNPSSQQLCGYYTGLPLLTTNQRLDFNWIENLYNTEIINGGRQV